MLHFPLFSIILELNYEAQAKLTGKCRNDGSLEQSEAVVTPAGRLDARQHTKPFYLLPNGAT